MSATASSCRIHGMNTTRSDQTSQPRGIAGRMRAAIAYAGRDIARPRYHANDSSRDQLDIVPFVLDITNARERGTTLDQEGFCLVAHRSGVADFGDREVVATLYRREVIDL